MQLCMHCGLDMLQHLFDAGYAGVFLVQQHMRGLQEP